MNLTPYLPGGGG